MYSNHIVQNKLVLMFCSSSVIRNAMKVKQHIQSSATMVNKKESVLTILLHIVEQISSINLTKYAKKKGNANFQLLTHQVYLMAVKIEMLKLFLHVVANCSLPKQLLGLKHCNLMENKCSQNSRKDSIVKVKPTMQWLIKRLISKCSMMMAIVNGKQEV